MPRLSKIKVITNKRIQKFLIGNTKKEPYLYQQFKHVSTKISIFFYSPDLSNPVEIFDPVDAVDILEVSVDGVPVVLDHPLANVALEGLGLGLALK